MLAKQGFDDGQPLFVEPGPARWPARPAIPVAGIAKVAFLPVQVGMHPRASGTFVLLGGFVSARPIALGVPPKTREGVVEMRRWCGFRERVAELVDSHG